MNVEYAATLAPHPWDAVGPAPKLAGTYETGETPAARIYSASWEYSATIRVENASEFTEDEIEAALAEAHAEDITRWRSASEVEDAVDVVEVTGTADYVVRLVRDGETIAAEVQ